MKRFAILILTICYGMLSVGQNKFGNEWITGGGGARIKFTDSGIYTNQNHYIWSYFAMGNSCISDTSGNLILASDGYNIYDSVGNIIDGGDTLVPKDFYIAQDGWSALSQSSIFLPMDSGIYYFITPAFSDSQYADCNTNNHCFFDLLLYNIVDMKANGGAGKVVRRMEPLMQHAQLSKTQMMACRHKNGKDWWLLKQGGDSNIVYTFLFTQDSVYDYGKQIFQQPLWGVWDIKGQSTFSEAGDRYATACQADDTLGEIFVADFNRCNGALSNSYVIQRPWGSLYDSIIPTANERLPVGLAFSPNGKYLYVAGTRNLYQYDLQDSSWYHVAGMDTTVVFQDYNTIYMGPDKKLYIGNFGISSKQMSVIDSPDVKGVGCHFCPRCLRLDSLGFAAYAGTPPCQPNYALGNTAVCWPSGTHEVKENEEVLIVYPNPANNYLFLKSDAFNKEIEITIYNVVGQEVLKRKFQNSNSTLQLDIHSLSQGMYLLKIGSSVKKFLKE